MCSFTFFSLYTHALRRCQLSQSMPQKGWIFTVSYLFPCTAESRLWLLSAAFCKFRLTRVSIKAAVVPLVCRAGGSAASPEGPQGLTWWPVGTRAPDILGQRFCVRLLQVTKPHKQRQRGQTWNVGGRTKSKCHLILFMSNSDIV